MNNIYRKVKKMSVLCLLAMIISFTGFYTVEAKADPGIRVDVPSKKEFSAPPSGIIPMKEFLEWRYKMSGGKLYRRLYNYSRNVWVGNWILCP